MTDIIDGPKRLLSEVTVGATSRIIIISVASLAIGFGAGIGTGLVASNSTPPSSAAAQQATPAGPTNSSPSGDASKPTQEGAKAAVDSYFAQLAEDTKVYQSKTSPSMDDKSARVIFDAAYQKTYALMKPDAFTADKRYEVVGGFAQFYLLDPAAKIESKPESYALHDGIAEIKGTDFTITLAGQVQKQDTSAGSGGKISLAFVGGKWLISGVTTKSGGGLSATS